MVHATLTLKLNDDRVFNYDIRLEATGDYELEVARLWQRRLGVALSDGRTDVGGLPAAPRGKQVSIAVAHDLTSLMPDVPDAEVPDDKPSK